MDSNSERISSIELNGPLPLDRQCMKLEYRPMQGGLLLAHCCVDGGEDVICVWYGGGAIAAEGGGS